MRHFTPNAWYSGWLPSNHPFTALTFRSRVELNLIDPVTVTHRNTERATPAAETLLWTLSHVAKRENHSIE